MDFLFFEEHETDENGQDQIRIKDALIQHIVRYENHGYITIFYEEPFAYGGYIPRLLALNIGPQTVFFDENRKQIDFSDVHVGMVVEVVALDQMTYTYPPHANAMGVTIMNKLLYN